MSQPVDQVYPNTYTKQPSSNSNGSFGPVFIVLAAVIAISAIACVFGRLCNRKHHRGNKEHHRGKAKPGRGHDLGPKEWESRQKPSFKDEDIEFGFDKRIPTAKVAAHGDPRGPKPSQNGGFKGQLGPDKPNYTARHMFTCAEQDKAEDYMNGSYLLRLILGFACSGSTPPTDDPDLTHFDQDRTHLKQPEIAIFWKVRHVLLTLRDEIGVLRRDIGDLHTEVAALRGDIAGFQGSNSRHDRGSVGEIDVPRDRWATTAGIDEFFYSVPEVGREGVEVRPEVPEVPEEAGVEVPDEAEIEGVKGGTGVPER
ncbi:Hypothetical predicted protein [Olea europaea subsp. europaea]|uniref:Uncharacterized protein n=1 Tax=Olea europaea subsp. europaea TaxID=158383 RepID=A0A8S0PVJ9_OLEEU|nr:Hypothetical predicted protein [Olea europaea subsp. europaea]